MDSQGRRLFEQDSGTGRRRLRAMCCKRVHLENGVMECRRDVDPQKHIKVLRFLALNVLLTCAVLLALSC